MHYIIHLFINHQDVKLETEKTDRNLDVLIMNLLTILYEETLASHILANSRGGAGSLGGRAARPAGY